MRKIQIRINDLLHKMIENRISDLHFHIQEDKTKLTYRRFKNTIYVEEENNTEVYDYLKFFSKLDLSLNNLPQTGSFQYIISDKNYYFRFAIIETTFRKSGVLRVLNLSSITSIKDISRNCLEFNNIYKIESGIILFAGITGSGKSTTQHFFLKSLINKQIYLLENPIEMMDESLMQIEISSKGLDFDSAITQLLRHDPDVIALGEVRKDQELKSLIRAGLSGHLVCSTIHAGDIDQVISRLIDLGANEYDLSHVLKTIIYQELKTNEKGEVYAEFKIFSEKEIKQKISQSKSF